MEEFENERRHCHTGNAAHHHRDRNKNGCKTVFCFREISLACKKIRIKEADCKADINNHRRNDALPADINTHEDKDKEWSVVNWGSAAGSRQRIVISKQSAPKLFAY